MLRLLLSFWVMLVEIATFWSGKLRKYWKRPSKVQKWSEALRNAPDYEAWQRAASKLDRYLGYEIWRNNPTSKVYDCLLITDRLKQIKAARDDDDLYTLVNLLRAGLVRNLGNIISPKLFNHSFGGTKYVIEEYIAQFADAIRAIAALPPPGVTGDAQLKEPDWEGKKDDDSNGDDAAESSTQGAADSSTKTVTIVSPPPSTPTTSKHSMMITMSAQTKLDFIHDTRQGLGRSALVLQGGAIFGLCHLGVVKALYLRGLLPRIIVGTATGAMMAALVGVHHEDDLPRVLKGDGIDLSAFTSKGKAAAGHSQTAGQSFWTQSATLMRRMRRFMREGYFLDVTILEECIRTNIGDLTFEEAYNRSKRILNITVAPAGEHGIPTLLNYVTAPNVLVWTAAVASNASSSPSRFYGGKETKILCKDPNGNIVPWKPASTVDFRHWTHASHTGRSPLQRVAELFNVNHYIISQARPYLIPFLQSSMHGPTVAWGSGYAAGAMTFLARMIGTEMRHRLRQLDTLRLLTPGIRRFLVDEEIPGASMTLVPDVGIPEFMRLLETPTQDTLDHWIRRGEQSVWPAMAALRVRCSVEMQLDRSYQQVRRLKASGLRRKASQMVSPERSQKGRGDESNDNKDKGKEKPRAKSIDARYSAGSGKLFVEL